MRQRPLTLNAYGGGRVGLSAYEIYVEVMQDRGETPLSKAEWAFQQGGNYDDTPLRDRITALEAAVDDIPAAYDDAPLLERINLIESAVASIPAPYNDSALRGRVEAIEGAIENIPEPYDDTALVERIQVLENAPAPEGYDDTQIRQDVTGLGERVATLEEAPAPQPVVPDVIYRNDDGYVVFVYGAVEVVGPLWPTGGSEPQPALTATLSPNPPIAGEVLTITFSAAPDSVSATLNGEPLDGVLTGAVWTATPHAAGPISVAATAPGHQAYEDEFVAALAPFSVSDPAPVNMTEGDPVSINLRASVTSAYPFEVTLAPDSDLGGATFDGTTLGLSGAAATEALSIVFDATGSYGQTAQITVTGVIHEATGEPGDDPMMLTGAGQIEFTQSEAAITVVEPAWYAGVYEVPAGTDPVLAKAPGITGTLIVGTEVTVWRSLWFVDPADGDIDYRWQLYIDGAPVGDPVTDDPGTMSFALALPVEVRGQACELRETLTQGGVDHIASVAFEVSAVPARANIDTFNGMGNGVSLASRASDSGIVWQRMNSTSGQTNGVNTNADGYAYSSTGDSNRIVVARGDLGAASHYAGIRAVRGTYVIEGGGGVSGQNGLFPAVRVQVANSEQANPSCIAATFSNAANEWRITRFNGSTTATHLATAPNAGFGFDSPGDDCDLCLTVDASTNEVTLFVNGLAACAAVDTVLTGNTNHGMLGWGTNGALAVYADAFFGGAL